jgi:hypothetical protein
MYKSLAAVVFAAGCAAVFVGAVPPPTPATAATQTGKHELIAATKSETLTLDASIGCQHAWPYYEASCLRDSRRQNGGGAVVRVIALDKFVTDRIQIAQR